MLFLLVACDKSVDKDNGVIDSSISESSNVEKTKTDIESFAKNTIIIRGMKYDPEVLKISKGDTVTWINKDYFIHNVVESQNENWSSPEFDKDESWKMVFSENTEYYCSLHKTMKGKILVD